MKVTSEARKWAMPVYVVFVVLVGALLVWYLGNGAFAIAAVVGGAALIFLSPRMPWGYEIDGTRVSVTRPFNSKSDVTFDLSEVAHAEYFSVNWVKRMNVRLDDGHRFGVIGLGTQNLDPFAQAVMGAYQARVAQAGAADSAA